MGRLSITRVSADQVSLFLEKYYPAEEPFIIEGVPVPDSLRQKLGSRTALDEIVEHEDRRDANVQATGWVDVTAEVLLKQFTDARFQHFVAQIIPSSGVSFRRTWVRVFGYEAGNITSWHYDGNGIHVLNLCVEGRKHWQLVSPKTPLVHLPFKIGAFQHFMPLTRKQRENLDWMEFEAGAGDLLFVPRGWAHHVISLDPWNTSVSWVFTPTNEEPTTDLGMREMACVLAMDSVRRSRLWPVLPAGLKAHVENEIAGEEFDGRAAAFRKHARARPLMRAIARELSRLPLAVAAQLLYETVPNAER